MRLQLECLDDLKRAERLASWLGRPSVNNVVVLLPWLDATERDRSARAIYRLFNDCGCAAATAAAFGSVAVAVLVLRLSGREFSWQLAGAMFVVGLAAAAAGKLAGLAWSRWRLRVRLRRMSGRG